MKFDTLIVGGGLAGTSLAIRLAKAGQKVCLFEKSKAAHHKVCGEFLSFDAVEFLGEIGLKIENGANLTELVLHSRSKFQMTLPKAALGYSRFNLDERLLELASKSGVEVRRGQLIKSFSQDTVHGVRGDRIVLATGKHDIKSRSDRPRGQQVGFKMHFRSDAKSDQINLFLVPGGYGGLSQIEDGKFNFCFVMDGKIIRELKGEWEALKNVFLKFPEFQKFLANAQEDFERPLTVANIPYGYLVDERSDCYTLGDQAAVIPSLTGDGMAMALCSAKLAAEEILTTDNPANFHSILRRRYQMMMTVSQPVHWAFSSGPMQNLTVQMAKTAPAVARWIYHQTRVST